MVQTLLKNGRQKVESFLPPFNGIFIEAQVCHYHGRWGGIREYQQASRPGSPDSQVGGGTSKVQWVVNRPVQYRTCSLDSRQQGGQWGQALGRRAAWVCTGRCGHWGKGGLGKQCVGGNGWEGMWGKGVWARGNVWWSGHVWAGGMGVKVINAKAGQMGRQLQNKVQCTRRNSDHY